MRIKDKFTIAIESSCGEVNITRVDTRNKLEVKTYDNQLIVLEFDFETNNIISQHISFICAKES